MRKVQFLLVGAAIAGVLTACPSASNPGGSTGMKGTWDGTLSQGGESYNVRYVFSQTDAVIQGSFAVCKSAGTECQTAGDANGVVQGSSAEFRTTFVAAGEQYVFDTKGSVNGSKFAGTFDGGGQLSLSRK